MAAVALTPISPIQAKEKENQTPKSTRSPTAFPALDILPEGSILQRVRLPRYDKNYHPISLLTADVLKVLDAHKIDGENVSIEIFNKNGVVQMRTDMRHAIYNQENSTLVASEAVTLKGDSFRATGTGLVFHWHSNRGFLLGPATSQFIINHPNTSSAMQLSPIQPLSHRAFSLAGVLISLTTTSLIAERPNPLTPSELAELDQITQSSQSAIEQQQQQTSKTLSEEQKTIDANNASMRPFLKEIGQDNLIVKNTTSQTTPQKTKNSTSSAPSSKKSSPPKNSKKGSPKTPPQLLHIDCDGGIYFDSDTGVLVYLKNIRLTEPRFKLNCSDELKIILDKKPVEPTNSKKSSTRSAKSSPKATNVEKDSTKKAAKDQKKETTTSSFNDIKRIIAIGNVRVVSTDEKGNTFIATGETASYNVKTEEMILRGGLPRIQYGPNQYLQSKAPGQYIRILKNGKLVTTGKWAMQIDTSKKNTTP